MSDGERLMSLAEVADHLGVSIKTLYSWRSRGQDPPGYRIGRHVRYRRAEVEAWLERHADEQPEPTP